MISALIAWGIGFGGVNYIPGHGLLPAAPPIVIPTISPRALSTLAVHPVGLIRVSTDEPQADITIHGPRATTKVVS